MEPTGIIELLDLQRHPEGGWYRETWRSPAAPGERSAMTAIHFLLEAGQRSHWHKVDADELWAWHAGSALQLLRAAPDGRRNACLLGGDVLAGQQSHLVIPAGHWQAAQASFGWALVSCVVAPGFEFSGFELAPPGWEPGG
ncbi:cupin domain-containing protein [Sandaracinobacteroides hominis]|uniref:cupin domain-containing protein n=1 Tax=Sandaracinobacteroides hominis TaxID=2780086 RepID=UPI0018F56629|nr:cupin domain-containing protein [Sandaracinobacteroides hominis]